MPPEYVRPYVKAHKIDDRDADAIAEAVTRLATRFVELKSQVQLGMQTLHRARDRLADERTGLINQQRAILMERGIAVPQGRCELERELFTSSVWCDGAKELRAVAKGSGAAQMAPARAICIISPKLIAAGGKDRICS
jgi:transposase